MNKPLPNSPLDSLTEDVFVKGSNSESVPSAGTERELSMPLQGSNPGPSDVPSWVEDRFWEIWHAFYVADNAIWNMCCSFDCLKFFAFVCRENEVTPKQQTLGTPEGAYVSRGNEGKENPQVVPATEGNAPPRTQTKDPIYNAMEMDSDMSMSQHDVLTKCCGVGTRCQYEGTIDYCLECGKEGPEFLAEGEVYVDEGEGI